MEFTRPLTNVKYAIYEMVFDATIRANVMASTALFSNLEGHLDRQRYGTVGVINKLSDSSRPIEVVLRSTIPQQALTYMQDGAILRVTHRRHAITRQWVAVSSSEQYISKKTVEAVPNTLDYVLYLEDKDAS